MRPGIVQLTTHLARAGAETQVARIACGLQARGWDVTVVSLLPPAAFQEELRAAGVPVFSLGMQEGRPSPRGLLRLAVLLRRLRPQILHSHLFHANLLARAARLVCPVPVAIATVHSMAETGRNSREVRNRDRAYRFTEPLSDLMVAVSEAAAKRHTEARAAHAGRMRVVPNGVDTSVFRPNPERRNRMRRELGLGGQFAWLAVGRLMWKKDFASLLRAFGRSGKGVLLLAGEGPEEERLRALAAETGKDIRFLGLREDVPALMNAADAFVLSSVVEGLPVVLLEAAASGLPCVATDVGGVREAVVDETTGLTVPPQNEEALRGAMSHLAELPSRTRDAMARAARKLAVSRFDYSVVIRQWERLYLEMLEGHEENV